MIKSLSESSIPPWITLALIYLFSIWPLISSTPFLEFINTIVIVKGKVSRIYSNKAILFFLYPSLNCLTPASLKFSTDLGAIFSNPCKTYFIFSSTISYVVAENAMLYTLISFS